MINTEEGLQFNKNEKQYHFNQIKGEITEINLPDENAENNDWCSITLKVGHENSRSVNLCAKRNLIDGVVANGVSVGDKVVVLFYLTSRFKNNRWYSTANILQVDKA
jgi:hypothetical protein